MKLIPILLIGVGIFLLAALVAFLMPRRSETPQTETEPNGAIRYVAVGDSYTIGEGAQRNEAWPTLLVKHLQSDGAQIELVANTALTGATTEDVLRRQLPLAEAAQPHLVTLMIGVNDLVKGDAPETFEANLVKILDALQGLLPAENQLVLITIPDFTAAPTGKSMNNSLNLSHSVAEFNSIIVEQAQARRLHIVDIFSASQKMGIDMSLVAVDGLHPSAKGYSQWEALIYPTIKDVLTYAPSI